MPIHGSLGLSASQTKTKEELQANQREEVDQRRQQEQTARQSGLTRQQQETQQRQELFSAPTLNLLENLVKDLAPKTGGQAGNQLVDTGGQAGQAALDFNARAGGAQEDITGLIQPIVDNARFQGERELETLQTQLAQQAGGSLGNTFVTAATAEGRTNLESKLASMEAQLKINARGQETQERLQGFASLLQNVQAGQAGAGIDLQAFLGSLQALKGGVAETTGQIAGQTVSEQESVQNLVDMLNRLTQAEQQSTSRVESSTIGATAAL